jgi:hypothetical protein
MKILLIIGLIASAIAHVINIYTVLKNANERKDDHES